MDKNYSDLIKFYTGISKQNWIPLINIKKETTLDGIDDIFLISALIENNQNTITNYLKEPTWGFSTDTFGHSTFYKQGDEIYYVAGDIVDDMEYIVTYRTFNKYEPVIEINPKLIWYGNLLLRGNEYINADNDQPLIKVSKDSVLVERKYLRDFLAANKKVLAICFDNRRYYKEEVRMKYNSDSYENSTYNISLVLNSVEYKENNAMSCLLGKTLLMSTSEPLHEHYKYFFEKDEYEEFIIGVDDNEEPILFTCNENELANYFGANPDAPHFLTPVYFKRNVLDRYTNNPNDYAVSDGNLSYLDRWSIPFTVNKESYVIVWLGDLGRIPYSEQKYWKVFNEKPEGEIEEKFFKRQILAEWTDAILPEKEIFHLIDNINQIMELKYGQKLFTDLGDADKKLKSAFSIPTNNSVTVFQNFLMQLNKITVERINTKLIKQNVPAEELKDESGNALGSRVQLNLFLEKLNIKAAERLDNSLKISYNSRNKLAGHKGSIKEYNKVWKRDAEFKPDFISDSKLLLTGINIALNNIIEELQNDAD
ncbi:hypothetical protein P9597_28870 [Aneurinibacillus migulanus]|uniref:hypothetical protein n=1 Tax=Aneurinibacillus migulanus TaxID=47500 RepID=UPI002E1BC6C4|nr:hypothetical protein [Aneurinibacillus migulanus]